MSNQRLTKRGFTLLEILIVIGIAIIIVAIVLGLFRDINSVQEVRRSTDIVRLILDDARSRTLASHDSSQYGVHFELGSTTLFMGPSFSESDPFNEVELLPSRTELSSVVLAGGSSDVVFERLTGAVSATGTITISLVSDASNAKTVRIGATGITYEVIGGYPDPVCSPESQFGFVFVGVDLTATGGAGNYIWSAPGGVPHAGIGTYFSTRYSTPGTKIIRVTNSAVHGGYDVCSVIVEDKGSKPPVNPS